MVKVPGPGGGAKMVKVSELSETSPWDYGTSAVPVQAVEKFHSPYTYA